MSKLNILGLSALVLNLLGYIPKIGHLFSLAGFIVGVLTYRELEALGLIKGAWKLFTTITLLSLVAVALATLGYIYQDRVVLAITVSGVAYVIGLIIAWVTYRLSQQLELTAGQTQSKSFKVTAIILKISAFTMPVLVGFLIQGLAQLVFLIAAIIYKPNQVIKD